MEPPTREHLVSLVHQRLYCELCRADPETFAGGRVSAAMILIRNAQNIARHYLGAEIGPTQKR